MNGLTTILRDPSPPSPPPYCTVPYCTERHGTVVYCRLPATCAFPPTDSTLPRLFTQVLSLGAVLAAFSLFKALAARAPRLFLSRDLPVAFEVVLDVLISVLMVMVVSRQKAIPAMILYRPERSNSFKYIIKVQCKYTHSPT